MHFSGTPMETPIIVVTQALRCSDAPGLEVIWKELLDLFLPLIEPRTRWRMAEQILWIFLRSFNMESMEHGLFQVDLHKLQRWFSIASCMLTTGQLTFNHGFHFCHRVPKKLQRSRCQQQVRRIPPTSLNKRKTHQHLGFCRSWWCAYMLKRTLLKIGWFTIPLKMIRWMGQQNPAPPKGWLKPYE